MSYDYGKISNDNSMYVKWDTPGQTVTGVVVEVTDHTFPEKQQADGSTSPEKTVPVLRIDSRERGQCQLTCSNADLLEQVLRVQPQTGDEVQVEFLREITTSFGGKKKLFSVKHHPSSGVGSDRPPYTGHPEDKAEKAPF